MKKIARRSFIKYSGLTTASLGLFGLTACNANPEKVNNDKQVLQPTVDNSFWFNISLAQWSLHRAHQSGKMSALDFAQTAKQVYSINAIEYVNQFFKDKANDRTYLGELKSRAEGEDVISLLIMCDGEGDLGDTDPLKRKEAVENHFKWVEAAKYLGCHSIRVNAAGKGTADEVAKGAVKGLSALSTFAKDFDINVIVENHGGYSSDGKWLSRVIRSVNMPNCGTLPDFGNFCIEKTEGKCINEYDRYKGVRELLPFAKAVSAKSYDFDQAGNVIETNYYKMMALLKEAGYNGYVGIEYEGSKLSEKEGILKTKELLETVREDLK